MELRRATEGDGPGIAAVRLALGDAHDDSGASARYRSHLLSDGHLWVAIDDGSVVGFAGARDIDGARLLSDLFIDPARHGAGIGQALLAVVMAGSTHRLSFASNDPRAMPLYLRAGMYPRWPLLYLEGPTAALVGHGRLPCEEVSIDLALELERRVTGSDRRIEYSYWVQRPGTVCHTVGSGSVAVSAFGAEAARLEHVAVAPGDDPYEVAAAVARRAKVPRLLAYVRGTSPMAKELLEHGYRIIDSDMAMSSSPDAVPEALHILHPGLM